MSSSPPANGTHTSVFNALGSYADRIRDANGKPIATTSASQDLSPSQAQIQNHSSRSPSASKPLKENKTTQPTLSPASAPAPAPENDDDGEWETVQSGRQRTRAQDKTDQDKDKRSAASTSRNWRERPQKENAVEDDSKRLSKPALTKKSESAPPPTEKLAKATADKPVVATSARNPWATVSPPAAVPIADLASTFMTVKSKNTAQDRASAAADENEWRSRPTQKEAESPVSSRTTAPPPTVNAWDLRKKVSAAAPAPSVPAPAVATASTPTSTPKSAKSTAKASSSAKGSKDSPSAPSQSQKGDEPKSSKKKKKAAAAAEAHPPAIADATLWPDIAQSAETFRKDEKRDKAREQNDPETSSATEEAAAGLPKKTKWTAIPAAELLAAADEQAEASRRQNAARKKSKAESGSGSGSGSGSSKSKTRKGASERKAIAAQHGSDLRLPPAPHDYSKESLKPVLESVQPGSEGDSVGDKEAQAVASVPLSRQSSRPPSQHASPSLQTAKQLPKASVPDATRQETPTAKPMQTSVPAPPVAQTTFGPSHNGTGSQTVPRPPGGRGGRSSFSGRGRGYRGIKGFTSPVIPVNGLPADNLYTRGYGMGYGPFVPGGAFAQAGYDPIQVQYMYMQQLYSRGAAPPPPMPQTQVPGIDAHRFYVLGQVEYYFSMQNLAMDFFLRQQMDSEGWIDISMIASFNRLRSLTPDVAMVKEVMELSSLLEVRGDKVRLAGAEAKRWVLPDAKPSSIPPDPASEAESVTSPRSYHNGLDVEEQSAIGDMALSIAGLGLEDMPKYTIGNVHNALMKTQPTSSTASVQTGDVTSENTATPATSMSGREEGDVEVDEGEAKKA